MTKKYTPRHLLLISQLKSADAGCLLLCIDHLVDDYPDCLDSVSGAFWEWDLEAAVAKRGNPG